MEPTGSTNRNGHRRKTHNWGPKKAKRRCRAIAATRRSSAAGLWWSGAAHLSCIAGQVSCRPCENSAWRDSQTAGAILESGMAHISGFERDQLLLLPEAVDDYVGSDNPVRFIDAF